MYSSKFSPGGNQTRQSGAGLSPTRENLRFDDNYSQPGVEIVDPNQEDDDPFQNTMNLPVRQHHNKLEVFILRATFLIIIQGYGKQIYEGIGAT